MVPTLKEVIRKIKEIESEKNGPKITLNHFTFFVNIFYPFNCDKPIPYHLTEGTRGNIGAKQELLLEETTKYLPFLTKSLNHLAVQRNGKRLCW